MRNKVKSLNISKLLETKDRVTIDIVGDSITWGLSHCSEDETYAAQFAEKLSRNFPLVSVYRYDGLAAGDLEPMKDFSEPIKVSSTKGTKRIDVIKNGICGNTVRRAINRINDFTGILANGETADITFLMFGINDALKTDKDKYVTSDKFRDDYRELINKFKISEKSQIVIMSATTNDQSIAEYVKMTEAIAREYGILYIDQNKVWNEHYDRSNPNFGQGDWLSNVQWDACHPTSKGAKAIADEMMKYIV